MTAVLLRSQFTPLLAVTSPPPCSHCILKFSLLFPNPDPWSRAGLHKFVCIRNERKWSVSVRIEAPDFMLGCECAWRTRALGSPLPPIFSCLGWSNTDICKSVLGMVSQAEGRPQLLRQKALNLLAVCYVTGCDKTLWWIFMIRFPFLNIV